MSVRKHVRSVSAKLESPFVSQGLWAYAPGLDTALARDHLDRLIIPGSQLKGVLRDILREMLKTTQSKLTLTDLNKWLGQGSGDAYDKPDSSQQTPFEPDKGRARFDDLICQTPLHEHGGATTRIEMDGKTGSVQEGYLQVLEMPFPYGAQAPFAGEIAFYGEDDEASRFWEVIALALKFVPALGAIKSSGFGNLAIPPELASPQAEAAPLVDFSPAQGLKMGDRVTLELAIQEPFVVDATLIGGNIYQGNRIIPGAVVKGSLAHQLTLAAEMDEALNKAVSETLFSHAFPVEAGNPDARRPRWLPWTLVEAEDQPKIYDCFMTEDQPKLAGKLLTYSIDWKSSAWAAAKRVMGWPSDDPDYHVRTRTAIDRATKGAEKGKLFSYRAVAPGCLRWRMVLDRGDADPEQFRRIVGALLGGLEFLGKTEARVECHMVEDPCAESAPESCAYDDEPTVWRVTLQTPALMLDTAKATCQPDQKEPFTAAALYEAYWRHAISLWNWRGGSPQVKLKDFRAAQIWEGGYRARRFRLDPDGYRPYLLTQAGSVFLVAIQGPGHDEQAEFFAHLGRRGLPLHDAGSMREPGRWKECPYTPENGYGEVRVDWRDAQLFGGGVPVA